jgi:hypothetical protein
LSQGSLNWCWFTSDLPLGWLDYVRSESKPGVGKWSNTDGETTRLTVDSLSGLCFFSISKTWNEKLNWEMKRRWSSYQRIDTHNCLIENWLGPERAALWTENQSRKYGGI